MIYPRMAWMTPSMSVSLATSSLGMMTRMMVAVMMTMIPIAACRAVDGRDSGRPN